MPVSPHSTFIIARTEILFRIRRTSGVVSIFLAAAFVYLIIPDLKSGNTLMQVGGRRVFYNSTAVALGTGMICAMLISIVGYYLVSNSFRRDILSRTGFILAGTTVTNLEYVLGKFVGNFSFLAIITTVSMLSAMGMFLIRGETSLEPLVFFNIYFWIAFPAIAFTAAAALAFESLSLLSGRFGDILFFFLWAMLLGLPGSLYESGADSAWSRVLDIVGIVQIMSYMNSAFHTMSMSVGHSPFDPSRSPVFLSGIAWSGAMIVQRLSTLAVPVVLLVLARAWFHRFDPVKIKSSIRQNKRNLLSAPNILLKPITRTLNSFSQAGGATLPGAVRADLVTTLLLSPLTALAIIVFAILSLSLEVHAVRSGLLPVIVGALIVALAEISTRDSSSDMLGLLFTMPKLRNKYVWWKFFSALVVTISFTAIPAVRLLVAFPSSGVSLLVGSVFITSGAVGFGIMTRNPKLFVAVFLMLLYVGLNATTVPDFDFAGFLACATVKTQLMYAAISIFLLLAAFVKHKSTIAKE